MKRIADCYQCPECGFTGMREDFEEYEDLDPREGNFLICPKCGYESEDVYGGQVADGSDKEADTENSV